MNALSRFFFPGVNDVHSGWLQPILGDDSRLMSLVTAGRHSRRLVAGSLFRHYKLNVPRRAELDECQRWLLLPPAQQRQLAQSLGAAACATTIRQAIAGPQVRALQAALGEDGYRDALRASTLAVGGLDRRDLEATAHKGNVASYLTAVGIALLELSIPAEDRFARLRMRFAFPPLVWRLRPRELTLDDDVLASAIATATNND